MLAAWFDGGLKSSINSVECAEPSCVVGVDEACAADPICVPLS